MKGSTGTAPLARRLAAILLIGGAASAGAQYDWSEVDAILEAAVPGTVESLGFAIVRGDETLYQRAIGQDPGHVALIASASKMPSAAALLTLVDDGSLDLDAPVGGYLAGAVDWPADKAAVTTRMLLNHTHGLAETPCLENPFTTLAACVEEIASAPLLFTPGSAFAYGGAGFQVAGLVAQELAGESWADLFAERIAAPLGLEVFHYGPGQNPRIGGGARSNVADYLKLLRFQLGAGDFAGHRVLSSGLAAVMRTDQIEGLPVVYSPLPWPAVYSFGWWFAPPFELGQSPGPELSDPGKFGTTPWIDLALGYGAVLLIEATTADGLQLQWQLRPAIQAQMLAHPGPGAILHRDGFEDGDLRAWVVGGLRGSSAPED